MNRKSCLTACVTDRKGFHSLDHGRVFGSVPHRPHPLVHHDARMSIDEDPQEEQYDGGYNHHPQRVQLVVLREAWAVKVEAGVELYTDQCEDDTDPIRDGLRVRLEVLQDQLQPLHNSGGVETVFRVEGENSKELWLKTKTLFF